LSNEQVCLRSPCPPHQYRHVCIDQHITVIIQVVVVSRHQDVLLHLQQGSGTAQYSSMAGVRYNKSINVLQTSAQVVTPWLHEMLFGCADNKGATCGHR
jgi:hypothetical protein